MVAAVDAMAFGLEQEFASKNIRVNAVSSGVIDTKTQDPKRLADIVLKRLMDRAETAQKVAEAVL